MNSSRYFCWGMAVGVICNFALGSNSPFPLSIPKRQTIFPLRPPTAICNVVAWGNESVTNVRAVAIATGDAFSLALGPDGKIRGWGDNSKGQITIPQSATNIVSIAAGFQSAAAVRSDGTILQWGSVNGLAPTLTNIVKVAVGRAHYLALKSDGTVVAWGANNFGQTQVPDFANNIVDIAAGSNFSMALNADGVLMTWPQITPLIFDVVAIDAGDLAWAVLKKDGTVRGGGTLSTGLSIENFSDDDDIGVAVGFNHVSVIKSDRTARTFFSDDHVPDGLTNLTQISAGSYQTVALFTRGDIPNRARAVAQVVEGFVVAANILDSGSGYSTPPHVLVVGGGGTAATAEAKITDGKVSAIEITNAGFGYGSEPEIRIGSPPFAPTVSTAPSRVRLSMQITPNKQYQIESSSDLVAWEQSGPAFSSVSTNFLQEFAVSNFVNRVFRLRHVP